MKIQINVTKEVLEKSQWCSAIPCLDETGFKRKVGTVFNCAVALAVRDLFPMAAIGRNVIQFPNNYREWNLGTAPTCDLPPVATEFINQFDYTVPSERSKIPPLSFVIDVPDTVIDRIGINQVNEILSKSETLCRV